MEAQQVLSQYAILPEDKTPLFKAALSIALIEYPNLDINRELTKIDHITEEARKRIKTASNPDEPILLPNGYFFNELGIRGNIRALTEGVWLVPEDWFERMVELLTKESLAR